MKRILFSLIIIVFCCSVASSQSQTEIQRKRLVELNTAIQDLDQKAQDLNKQKQSLEVERAELLKVIAKSESEDDFNNSTGYTVDSVVAENAVKLLIHGNPKLVWLYGISAFDKRDETIAYLKKKLINGKAYIRCQDASCSTVLLYAEKGQLSLNAQVILEGLGRPFSDEALANIRSEFGSANGGQTVTTNTPSSTTNYPSSSSGTSSSTPGTEVHVRGYTRKDGTYVQPHTRSAPRRKP
jgi:hypothetical protein